MTGIEYVGDGVSSSGSIDDYWCRAVAEPEKLGDLTEARLDDVEFRRMAASLPSLCWIANADGYIVWYNQRWHDYCGSTPAEMEGWGWQSVHHPDYLATVIAEWTTAIAEGKPFEMVFPLRGADGRYRPFLTRVAALKDQSGTPRRWYGINVDISAQRASEEALLQSKAELAQALLDLERANQRLQVNVAATTAERDRLWDTSPDLLVVMNPQSICQRANPAWGAILGYEPDKLVGQRIEQSVSEEDAEKTRDAFAMAANNSMPKLENRYRHRDGSIRWFSWVAARSGDVIYATGRHITADKLAEEALRKAEDALRQSQKVEAVGQLTGGVAHDFNNLLTVIMGSVDMLRRPNVSEERRKRHIDAISTTADRAAKLTGQLLAFARRQSLKPQVFDTGDSVHAMRDMIHSLTGSRIRISFDLPENPCFVEADRSQFDTSIVNMALNARDAMEGEGELALAVRRVSAIPALRSHPAVPGDFVAVSLTDDGAGIAADQIDKIFEPFFTTKRVGEGTGLGLSQVFGFAKQSGGDILVTSREGEGATFTMYLPLVTSPNAVISDEVNLPAPTIGAGACVLVVEDNAEVGMFATEALSELGYRTVLAVDGMSALAILGKDSERFDVVFSDVVMPGMSGIELGQEIRRLFPQLPVILTSGYSSVLAENGTHGFELLQKPYSVDELSRVLQKVVDWRQRR